MLQRLFKLSKVVVNISVFFILCQILGRFFWVYFGKQYVYSHPVGGDYYNALTYLLHILNNSPFPPAGWFSFWNEGTPFIGGYPFLVFYLLKPFAMDLSPILIMNYFSFFTLFLFFATSGLLFWQVSKNWILAAGFTVLLLMTGASYYQLTTGGFIVSASTQFYLPLVLFLIYRFRETKKGFYFILSALTTGISLLHQAPTTLLMVAAPASISLFFALRLQTTKQKLLNVGIFMLISAAIGAIGLYTVFLQNFLGSGTGKCISEQCWGKYPQHLTSWMSPLPPLFTLILTSFVIIKKILKKTTKISILLPSTAALLFFIAYSSLAYFKLINGLSNVLFPTRTFWAINLLLLTTACASFFSLRKTMSLFSYLVASLICATIIMFSIQKPLVVFKDFTATLPMALHEYILPEFKIRSTDEIFPDFIQKLDPNYRLDIANAALNQWYYYLITNPSTKGYSNHPLGTHKDWQYFLETSSRNVDPKQDQELVKNRIFFLWDAFGIGAFETSQSNYPISILSDKKIIDKGPIDNHGFWYKISDTYASPIVAPTSTEPILFVGNDLTYNYFIRSIAIANLNSQIAIPVRGPKKISGLSKQDLELFKTIFIYDTSKSTKDYAKLEKFVKNGGNVFLETSAVENDLENPAQIFPTNSLKKEEFEKSVSSFAKTDAKIQIDVEKFSPVAQNGSPWKSLVSNSTRNWAKSTLAYDQKIVMAEGKFGQGYVIWSGINLPYHIVENNNLEEAKLLKFQIEKLVEKPLEKTEFTVSRNKPELIEVKAQNVRGIYFKENYDSGWKAKINQNNAKVYKAGLDFMYVTQTDLNQPITASIEFKGSFFAITIFWLSISSIFLTLLLLAFEKPAKRILFKIAKIAKSKFGEKIKKIVSEEND